MVGRLSRFLLGQFGPIFKGELMVFVGSTWMSLEVDGSKVIVRSVGYNYNLKEYTIYK